MTEEDHQKKEIRVQCFADPRGHIYRYIHQSKSTLWKIGRWWLQLLVRSCSVLNLPCHPQAPACMHVQVTVHEPYPCLSQFRPTLISKRCCSTKHLRIFISDVYIYFLRINLSPFWQQILTHTTSLSCLGIHFVITSFYLH